MEMYTVSHEGCSLILFSGIKRSPTLLVGLIFMLYGIVMDILEIECSGIGRCLCFPGGYSVNGGQTRIE